MALRRILAAVLILAGVCITRPVQAMDSIESQVFGFINGARSSRLIEHSGLLAAARAHSQGMASRGGLDHNDADARVMSAPPDPAEGNGAPDDGFATAAWCENVTYTTGVSASEAPRRIYEQWHRSGAHDRCMMNTGKNVAAVGVYYDGSSWWATFIAEVDRTPPGGGGAQPAQRPAPAPAAKPKAKPASPPSNEGAEPRQPAQPAAKPPSGASTNATKTTETSNLPSIVIGRPDGTHPSGTTTIVRTAQSALSTQAGPLRYEIEVGRWDTIRALPLASSPASQRVALPGMAVIGTFMALVSLIAFRKRSRKRPPEMVRRDVVTLPEVELVGAGSSHT
jgi:hypothetical protein